MAEFIEIEISNGEVGIEYKADTVEAVVLNRIFALELALHALTQRAIQERENHNLPIPTVLRQMEKTHTYRDLTLD